ncbi:MAG: hypothetical protein WD097_03875 [Balneolales bacterium]
MKEDVEFVSVCIEIEPMCTVTYLPFPNGCIITSNRDEKKSRPAAHASEMTTTSITSVKLSLKESRMLYADLNTGNMYSSHISG